VRWKFWEKKKPAEASKVPPAERKEVSGPKGPFLPWETVYLTKQTCPDCGHAPLLEGPSAGISTNFYCANISCGSRFNVAQFGSMVLGERISEPSPRKKGLLRKDV
jgi:hypothetical protein